MPQKIHPVGRIPHSNPRGALILGHPLIAPLFTLLLCAQPHNEEPRATGPAAPARLTLKSRTKLGQPSPLTGACYVSKSGPALVAAGGFSPDNGRTWSPLASTPDFDSKLPQGYRRERHPSFLDPETGRLVTILNAMDTPGLDPNIIEPAIALKTYYLRYRVSADGGKSYLFDEPIVQQGDFKPERPVEGVWVGKNSIFMGDAGSTLVRTRAGKILVPAQVCTLDATGELSSIRLGVTTYTDVLVLIGTWTAEHRLKWETSERVVADPARSTRGMIEPAIAEMA